MPILNYTTTISVDRTVAEIHKNLAKHGAKAILQEYDDIGRVLSISFKIAVGEQELSYRLPADRTKVKNVLRLQRVASRYQTDEHCERVAWRIIKDWIAAQLALVETQQATLDQVMLPYAIMQDGATVYEILSKQNYATLGAGAC